MHLNKDFRDLLRLFNEAGVKYLLVGAYAVIIHTEPRYTKDIDLWVKTDLENAKKVRQALKEFGAPISDLSIDDILSQNIFYKVGVEPNRIDVLTSMKGIHFEEAWENRKTYIAEGIELPVLSVEDLIKNKKAVGRPRDLEDVERLKAALKFFKNRPRESDKKLKKLRKRK